MSQITQSGFINWSSDWQNTYCFLTPKLDRVAHLFITESSTAVECSPVVYVRMATGK